jgi:hypothetical protein
LTKPARMDFTDSLFELLKETFEEGGNFFLRKDAALLQTLDAITPEVASREPFPGAPSIAAHCAHLDYYVRVNRAAIVWRAIEVDWPFSWRVRSVGVGECGVSQPGRDREVLPGSGYRMAARAN